VKIALRVKICFARKFKAKLHVWLLRRKILLSFLQKWWMMPISRFDERGVARDRHETRGGDAVAVSSRSAI
jgi:hypothetical protein